MIGLIILVVSIGGIMSMIINYLADVLPYTRKFSKPSCHNCGYTFRWNEYLFSFRCPKCKTRPSLRYFLVLIFSIAASLCAAIFSIKGMNYWEVVLLLTFLGIIIVIDIEHRAVLNETSIVGAVLMLILGSMMNGQTLLDGFLMSLLGGAVGFGIMLLLYYGGGLFAKYLGKIRHQEIEEVALGFGDVNVMGFLGLLIGWPDVLSMFVLAILLGGIISILVMVILSLMKKYRSFTAIPYAPFLVIATVVILFIR